MHLGIYAWDAGNIDGPRSYGSMDSTKFKKQFPNGWRKIAEKAKSFGCRLGIWLGPFSWTDSGRGGRRNHNRAHTDQQSVDSTGRKASGK